MELHERLPTRPTPALSTSRRTVLMVATALAATGSLGLVARRTAASESGRRIECLADLRSF